MERLVFLTIIVLTLIILSADGVSSKPIAKVIQNLKDGSGRNQADSHRKEISKTRYKRQAMDVDPGPFKIHGEITRLLFLEEPEALEIVGVITSGSLRHVEIRAPMEWNTDFSQPLKSRGSVAGHIIVSYYDSQSEKMTAKFEGNVMLVDEGGQVRINGHVKCVLDITVGQKKLRQVAGINEEIELEGKFIGEFIR